MLTSLNVSPLTCLIRNVCGRTLKPAVVTSCRFRRYSTEPLPLPTADEEPKVYSDKIKSIVADISKLNLMEVADLNNLLKKTLNISDAPVMAMGAMAVGQPKDEEDEETGAAKIQTNFTLQITKFDESKKVPLIKHVKTIMEGMNLVQAKKFVESLPAMVRKDAPKDEVEKLKEELLAVGAECSIE